MKTAFRNESGAIDLASIMVGIIVIGLIGGVIAATVFAVIPWAQDNAAKQQLGSIAAAESAYIGLTSASPIAVNGKSLEHFPNTYGDSARLADAGLLAEGDNYCATTVGAENQGYQGFVLSGSGAVFIVTDKNTKPAKFEGPLPAPLPDNCSFLLNADFMDGDSSKDSITMTYVNASGSDAVVELPLRGGSGTVEWSDGVTSAYVGNAAHSRTIPAGQTLNVMVKGTVDAIDYRDRQGAQLLTAVPAWGDKLGVKSLAYAFVGATNLTDVPDVLPETVTDVTKMFSGATNFNDSDVAKWNVSKVQKFTHMFEKAPINEAELSGWDTRSATNMAFLPGNHAWKVDDVAYTPIGKTTTLTYFCETWDGSPEDREVNLPIRNTTSDTTVTWSDGDIRTTSSGDNNIPQDWSSTASSPAFTKTLKQGIPYTVTIEGTYDRFSSETVQRSDADTFERYPSAIVGSECLTSVEHWGEDLGVTSMEGAFVGRWGTVDVPDHIPSSVTDISHMFAWNYVPADADISDWDTSNITDMSAMFYYYQPEFMPSLSGWNVSNVTNMSGMFWDNWASHSDSLNGWDVSNVTDMSYMFNSNYAFNQNINNWDVSNVKDMSRMFFGSRANQEDHPFNQPLNKWDVSSVENMASMFEGATTFNQNINNWDVSNVKDMSNMFAKAFKFDQPLDNWNTSSVTTMSGMFSGKYTNGYDTSAFNQNINNWDVSKVTNMSGMFRNSTFNQPLNSWNTESVTDMQEVFAFAREFNQPLNNWKTSNVTNMSGMFDNAPKFNQNLSGWDVSKVSASSWWNFDRGSALTQNNLPKK